MSRQIPLSSAASARPTTPGAESRSRWLSPATPPALPAPKTAPRPLITLRRNPPRRQGALGLSWIGLR